MSYSFRGIFAQYTNKRIYKFCQPGTDIFYYDQIIRKLSQKYSLPDHIILELPYYSINYDFSLTKENKLRFIPIYSSVDDWHHFGIMEDDKILLTEYKQFSLLFGEKRKRNPSVMSNNYEIYPVKNIDVEKVTNNEMINLKMWEKLHSATIIENTLLLDNLFGFITKSNPDTKISILIMTHSHYEYLMYKEVIDNMKAIFYSNINGIVEKTVNTQLLIAMIAFLETTSSLWMNSI